MRFIFVVVFSVTLGLYTSCRSPEAKQLGDWTPKISGCGGIFLNAQKGPLIIEIEKTDLKNDSLSRILRAVFVGPDRKMIQDINTSASENNEIKNVLRLETQVDRPGVYAIMITVSNDRYGENIAWRFKTNCDKYIIETSRGHKDQYHEEPIILADPEKETDLCFLPQRNEFDILITHLSDDIKTIGLKDAKDQPIGLLEVLNDTARYHVEEGKRHSIPWKLHFSKAQAEIKIEGVTRWDANDQSDDFSTYPDGALWTPSWFRFHDNRWLLTPYSRTTYEHPEEQKSASFKVHNNGTKPKKVKFTLEFPENRWDVRLSHDEVLLQPNEEKKVTLSWKGDSTDRSVHLRATDEEFTTYATLYVKTQDSNTDSPLKMPIVLKPYFHENEQFGYSPDYPATNQPYFNIDNKPYILSENGIFSFQNNRWYETPVNRLQGSIVAFDSEGDVYVLGHENNQTVLLHSTDNGISFKSFIIPNATAGTGFDIEQFTGHNIPDGPPPVMKYTRTGADKQHFWRKYGNLELLIPKKTNEGFEWEQPVLISDKCLGVSSHSGLPASVVSHKDNIFMVWGEVTDVNISREEIPGVPVFVTSYNKKTKQLNKPVLVGFGAPPNDTHNIPGITMDSEGFLHVLTGTHGRPFQYAKSLQPLSVNDGWSKAESLLDPNIPHSTQTYLGLVTDQENTLHTIFRFWQHNKEPFPDTHYARLAYMSKKPGQPWSEPQILVQAPLSHYSNFRHRLTIDRKGRLFISYDYWSTYWFYRTDRKFSDRVLIMSSDEGKSWKLASEDDFMP
ncbi:MAG: BNR repeat-containing protein [Tannerella sp.]|jgi:hypothetical protein|nr:BNR repeat-containing protein [Tannerella sp.]